jgi:hypothetical protein
MNVHSEPEPPPVTLRPARTFLRQGLFALALGSTLTAAVLYWLTVPNGVWQIVLTVHVGLVVMTAVIARQFLRVRIALTPDGVIKREFNGESSRVHRNSARLVLIIDIYLNHSAETLPHLFVADAEGRLLLRMRGQYWPREHMERVATHFAVPVQRPRQPVSMAEFYAASPELLYWFERASHDGRRFLSRAVIAVKVLTHSNRRN